MDCTGVNNLVSRIFITSDDEYIGKNPISFQSNSSEIRIKKSLFLAASSNDLIMSFCGQLILKVSTPFLHQLFKKKC